MRTTAVEVIIAALLWGWLAWQVCHGGWLFGEKRRRARPRQEFNVSSTASFPSRGTLLVDGQPIGYTDKTVDSFGVDRPSEPVFGFKAPARYLLRAHRGWGRRQWMRRPLEERIAIEARRLQNELAIGALPALAAAEAVEFGRKHGLRFDRVEYDDATLRWTAFYEFGPARHPGTISLPLSHATEATQRGIAALN